MINMLKALMDKADNMQEYMGKKKDRNVKRESKWILDIKNRNEGCNNFWWALVGSFLEWTWLKKKHEIMWIKTSKTEKKKY